MEASGSDTCQAVLAFWAYGWTNPEVIPVTTGRVTRGIFWLDGMNESSVNTWHALIGCEGATWPNHELPRGTPGLANNGYVKSFVWGRPESNW